MEFTEENSEFELDFGEIMEGGEVTGVSSVNGYTGDVVLSAQDVGAATPAQVAQTKADSQTYTDEKVAAVKEAVEAEIPTDTADLTNGAGFQNGVEVASAITSGISDHNSSATAHPAIRTQISTINSKIPAEASVSNQLSDKTFVSGLVSDEASARELADTNLQGQIDAITSASDVVDVVGTYSELQAYDTQHLNDNDIVKVLVDETHDNAITYYRWTHSTTPYSWIYIGSQGPFYTKAESDTLLNEKADKSNTYTKTEVDTALAGKVDKVAGKGLSTNDFTTEEKTKLAGLENTVLESTTGQSTTAGMTQKAITDALASAGGDVIKVLTTADYNWPATGTKTSVALWLLDDGLYYREYVSLSVLVGTNEQLTDDGFIFVSTYNNQNGKKITFLGSSSSSKYGKYDMLKQYSVRASGTVTNIDSAILSKQVINNLTSTSTYDVLSANQGKVLKDLIDSLVISGAGAPTTSTVGTVGKLYEDTTNGDLYQCTAVSGSTYTWEEVGGGGCVGDGIKVLTSADYNWNSTTQSATEPYDCVALWRLAPGTYTKNDSSVTVYYWKNGITMTNNQVAILNGSGSFGHEIFIPEYTQSNVGGSTTYKYGRVIAVEKNAGDQRAEFYLYNAIDNLTTTASGAPLDAHQGKVLDDKIAALEARIAALEGNA